MAATFVDTSGLYAVLAADDAQHAPAAAAWPALLDAAEADPTALVTHSGVVNESAALVQRRLGLEAVQDLLTTIVPVLDVIWVDADLHQLATTALLAARRRDVSLVDWTSFVVMRERGIDRAFAFDDDFVEQGFELIG